MHSQSFLFFYITTNFPFSDIPDGWNVWLNLDGIAIAVLYQFAPVTWGKIATFGNLLLLLGLLLLVAAYFCVEDKFSYQATVVGFPLISIAYGLVLMGAISPGSILYKWNSRVMTGIATLSYAIYLLHKGVLHMTQELIALPLHLDVNSNTMLFICLLTNVCAAGLLYLLIEKPCMNWRKRIIG